MADKATEDCWERAGGAVAHSTGYQELGPSGPGSQDKRSHLLCWEAEGYDSLQWSPLQRGLYFDPKSIL